MIVDLPHYNFVLIDLLMMAAVDLFSGFLSLVMTNLTHVRICVIFTKISVIKVIGLNFVYVRETIC